MGAAKASTPFSTSARRQAPSFNPYHASIIAVLGLVGFADGYDLVMTGSLLVLAKEPLQMTPEQVRFLAIASTLMDLRRRSRRFGHIRSFLPQDGHAERCCLGRFLYTADPPRAERRSADYHAPVDGVWRRLATCSKASHSS